AVIMDCPAQFRAQMLGRTLLEIAADRVQPNMVEVEQDVVEIRDVGPVLLDRLLPRISDVAIDLDVEMTGRDLPPVLRESSRVVLDRVFARRSAHETGCDRDVVRRGPLD